MRCLNRFIEFVNEKTQNFSQKKFEPFMSIVDTRCRLVMEKWIELAVKNRVEELDLSLMVENHKLLISSQDFSLPQVVYAAKSLKAMSLCNCKLDFPLSTINFLSLRKLSLDHVKLDECTFESLISSCPYIEDLILKGLTAYWKLIDISRSKYLKSVEIDYLERDERLEKLHCYNISSLTFKIESSSSLRVLRLTSVDIENQCLHDLIANSARIESIKLAKCNNLRRLMISSDSLRQIEISSCKELVETDILALNLIDFLYSGKLLSTFRHTSPLCRAVMFLQGDLRNDFSADKWIQFLSIAVQLKQLTLEGLWIGQGNVGLGEEGSQRALWRLESLVLGATARAWDKQGLVKSLIRWCRPKTASILKCDNTGKNFHEPYTGPRKSEVCLRPWWYQIKVPATAICPQNREIR